MKYIAIECETVEVLTEEVNAMIEDGWEPLGGVSTTLSESNDYQYFCVAQALIKKEK
tara:strand:+ start:337 stop:507 length:171 start_codon:yes stop_codon:yes gene_type:complete